MKEISINDRECDIDNIVFYKLAESELQTKSIKKLRSVYSNRAVYFIRWMGGKEAVFSNEYTLTESANSKEQIRYITQEDHEKYISCFFREYLKIHSVKGFKICSNKLIPDICFLDKASEFDLDIQLLPLSKEGKELSLLSMSVTSDLHSFLKILLKGGFAKLALSIFTLNALKGVNIDYRLALVLGNAHLMCGNVFDAEWHYNYAKKSKELEINVSALYSKAMLYVRHHRAYAT